MKRILYLSFLMLLIAGCTKADDTKYYKITAAKSDTLTAVLEIDGESYSFTGFSLQKDIKLEKGGVVDVSLSGTATSLSLDLLDNGVSVDRVSGSGYVWMKISQSGITKSSTSSSGGTGGGSTGSGGNCPTVQCSGTTQSGARCKRMTTNCSGRCWQH